LLWRALAVHLLDPTNRPPALKPFGETLHDQWLLPSQLWLDLDQVLDELERAGFPLERPIFQAIWQWRFPTLLGWSDPTDATATLEIRRALEPWPLLCDTPVEGGSTSRFVDSSLRRFEVISTGAFRKRYGLVLNGRPLMLGDHQPVAVRYRQEALYPCLHPCIANHLPLDLQLIDRHQGQAITQWTLPNEATGFECQAGEPSATTSDPTSANSPEPSPWRGARPGACTVDMRLG
jgi:uncharacterized protein (DUF2126 family)